MSWDNRGITTYTNVHRQFSPGMSYVIAVMTTGIKQVLMFAGVTKRKKEVGLTRARGKNKIAILQFLIESIIKCSWAFIGHHPWSLIGKLYFTCYQYWFCNTPGTG